MPGKVKTAKVDLKSKEGAALFSSALRAGHVKASPRWQDFGTKPDTRKKSWKD